ncbi:lysine decarboxylase [Anaerosolibacter carboniphilus]|uniref:Lysine decarboxylase n=1 Tax=Anaerosolibacter carboniphilus TaxID=1417629 RepID=A0A841L263_9FIRM|nr:aminotransferase class I/II-fold pyridoxal phosphate-dependent enzyme [Anaerosolibacter carboniphilus]MBB6218708.1 lysine decarboxylase [Anaerosolibacter carboniphilus]
MDQPIILDRLLKHSRKDMVSFHVPGHKSGKIYDRFNYKNFTGQLLSIDITEIPGTDNLHAPEEMIKKAQEKAARFYKADHTFFLVDGTSCGIIAMLMAVANPGDKVIVPRDCHKSVIHGLILGNITPVYIQPEVWVEKGISMGIRPETVEQALKEYPEAKAVLITYPNYYGICSDIEAIATIVHKYDKILLVDEAHGAHFNLSDLLPMSALEAGADIVAQSTHKTLPAFTQASMLHVRSQRIDVNRLKVMLAMQQSTSPSYLLMASLDLARTIAEAEGKFLMNQLLGHIETLKNQIMESEKIKILDHTTVASYGVKAVDPTKLVIDMTALGIQGTVLEELLRTKYHIQMELANINVAVAVATIGNERKDFDRLAHALMTIKDGKGIVHRHVETPLYSYQLPKMKLTPRQSIYMEKSAVDFADSSGKISGEYLIPYPPGIPIVCPGEEITTEVIEYIKTLKKNGIQIVGLEDTTLQKIKVIEL